MRHWRRRLGSIPFCRISNYISHSHLYWSYSRRSNNREWNRLDLLTNAFHPSSLFRPETIGGCHHPDGIGAHVYAPLDTSAPDDRGAAKKRRRAVARRRVLSWVLARGNEPNPTRWYVHTFNETSRVLRTSVASSRVTHRWREVDSKLRSLIGWCPWRNGDRL